MIDRRDAAEPTANGSAGRPGGRAPVNESSATGEVSLIRTEAELDALQKDWNALADRTLASYFSSFEYVRTAWTHFHHPGDQLCVVVVRHGESVVGIAPLYSTSSRRLGIPCRIVKFIAMWEGDRPLVLANGNEEEDVWRRIIGFLAEEHGGWDILELREQSLEGPAGRGWGFLPQPGLLWEHRPDSVAYYVPLEGSWHDYIGTLSANTRRNWRRKATRLREAHGDYDFECLTDPHRVKEGIERFVAVERLGWKPAAGLGLAKDAVHEAFYGQLLHRLGSSDALRIHFLKSRGADLAAQVDFVHRTVVYARHTAYSLRYSEFSPGVLLLAEAVRQLFGGSYQEYDLLGMREDDSPQQHKVQWARGRRETVALTAYRRFGRLAPWLGARALYRRLRSATRATASGLGGVRDT